MNRKSRRMSNRKYNSHYAKRGRSTTMYCKVYYRDENTIITSHHSNFYGKILTLLYTPFIYLALLILIDIDEMKTVTKEISDILKGRSLSSDATYKRDGKSFDILAEYIETGKLNKAKNSTCK